MGNTAVRVLGEKEGNTAEKSKKKKEREIGCNWIYLNFLFFGLLRNTESIPMAFSIQALELSRGEQGQHGGEQQHYGGHGDRGRGRGQETAGEGIVLVVVDEAEAVEGGGAGHGVTASVGGLCRSLESLTRIRSHALISILSVSTIESSIDGGAGKGRPRVTTTRDASGSTSELSGQIDRGQVVAVGAVRGGGRISDQTLVGEAGGE